MKLISIVFFVLFLQQICFGNAYFFNCDTCGFSQISYKTISGSRSDTIITKTIKDSQMVCIPDSCYWTYIIHYDTSINTYSTSIIKSSWKQCIKYSLFDDSNQRYKILPYGDLFTPHGMGNPCGSTYKVDSIWGVIDTTPSINNIIYFIFTIDTLECLNAMTAVSGINESNGDTIWGCPFYKTTQSLSVNSPLPNQFKYFGIRPANLANIINQNPTAIRIYSLQGKEISIPNYTAFKALSKGIYIITYESKNMINILK